MLTRAFAVATLILTLLWAAFPLCFGWREVGDDSIATMFMQPLRRGQEEIRRRSPVQVFYGDPPFLLGANAEPPTFWTRSAEVFAVSPSRYLVLQWVRAGGRQRVRLVSSEVVSATTSRLAAEGVESRLAFAGCRGSSAYRRDSDLCRDKSPTPVCSLLGMSPTVVPTPELHEDPPCEVLCFSALGEGNVLWHGEYEEDARLLPKYALVDSQDIFIFAAVPTHPFTYSVVELSLPTGNVERTWSVALSPSEAPTSVTRLSNHRFLLNIPSGARSLDRSVAIGRFEYGAWGDTPWPWANHAFWTLGTTRLVSVAATIVAFVVIAVFVLFGLRRRNAVARGLIENLERVFTLDSDGTVCIADRRVHVSLSPAQQRLVKANKGSSLSVLLDSDPPVYAENTTYRTAAALTVAARAVFRGGEEEAYRELETGSVKIATRLTFVAAAVVALLHAILFDTV